MSLELLNQLEQKINTSLEALELLSLEMEELKQENAQLKQTNAALTSEQEAWEGRLTRLLEKFNAAQA